MKIIFFGTSNFAVKPLEILHKEFGIFAVFTQEDKPAGRGRKLTPSPIKKKALELGISVYQPEKLDFDTISKIKDINPDFIIVVAYGKILPEEILNLPKYYALNLHPSLLPKYRGAAPINWAIMNGEKYTGISIIKMTKELDAGDILYQEKVEIGEEEDAKTLSERLSQIGGEALKKVIPLCLEGKISLIPQDENLATYAPKLKKEDGLINWEEKGEKIKNKVRGLIPWPCAYSYLKGKMIKILKVSVIYEKASFSPGTIVLADKKRGILVSASDSLIKIEKLQPEGRKVLSWKEYLVGLREDIRYLKFEE